MAGDGSIANDPLFSDLLQKLIGTSTSSKTGEDLSVANLIKQLTNQTSDQRLTGLTNQNTNQQQSGSSTNTQNQNQALTGSTTQNQTQTGSNTSTQNTTADISRLTQVFNQQQKGITPEALAAIFTQGAKAVPGLTAATANAVGARSSDNSALATSLTDLNSNLVSQAATQNQALLNASGTTAAQIADLTKQLTTQQQNSGSTFGNTGTNQNTALTGTTGTVNSQNTFL